MLQKYSHDIPMSELDGQHAKSIHCPCAPDVEQVTPRAAIVYHQSVSAALTPASDARAAAEEGATDERIYDHGEDYR